MEETDVQPPEAESDRPGLLTRLNVLIFLVVVLAGEAIIAYCFIPSADDVATATGRVAGQPISSQEELSGDMPGLQLEGNSADLQEFDLDTYSLAVPNLAAGTSWRVDFHLWGIVHEDRQDELQELYSKHKHRIRDSVGTIIRRSETADLNEDDLGLIKRKVSAKVNQTLGTPLLHGVVFSEFFFYQQYRRRQTRRWLQRIAHGRRSQTQRVTLQRYR